MSKNGKLLFRNFDPYITSSFGYRIHPITNVNTLHTGVDYGTNGVKLPTYAIEEGKVLEIGVNSGQGNYVYVTYPRLGKNGLYQHLDKINVKNGQIVDENTIIGYVGATGEVTGIHLHFGWFNSTEQNKAWSLRKWENFEEYEYLKPLDYLGSPIERDRNKDQIEVIINNLRVRKSANGEILGYVNPGLYNILEIEINGDYTWYKIGYNMWIAYQEDFANLYLKEEIKESVIEDKKDLDDILEETENNNLDNTIEKVDKLNFFEKIFKSFRVFFEKISIFFKKL